MFDVDARRRIRAALVAYMQAHQLGVPTLAKRISEANHRRPEVPIKTLQRFVAGEMRTNDAFVGMCAKFTEALPVPDPIGDLGRAMLAVYRGQQAVIVGDFTTIQSRVDGEFMPDRGSFFSVPDNGFCRATIRFESFHAIYEGPMILSGHYNLAEMADRLTLEPFYMAFHAYAHPNLFMGNGTTTTYAFTISVERARV